MVQHSSHPNIIKRLKRASGHLNSVITMLEEEKGCLAIAQQIQAVEGAITKAKKTLIHDHIDHCLERSTTGKNAAKAIKEFKEITKYL
jgi:DNA-binding FrmR family transcriptional regulator